MPGLRKGSRRLDKALREAQARLARHFAAIERLDPVDVHQARVASRRIRSLLKTFRRHFRQDTAGPYRRDLGRAARQLGPLRDLDVLASQPGMRSPAVSRTLLLARRTEVTRLRRRLRGGLRRGPIAFAAPTTAELGLEPDLTTADLARTVRREWRRVERLLVAKPADAEALHALRIRLKNLRYAIEVIGDPGDESAAQLLTCLRSAQSHLGAEHDVACARAWLERSGAAPPAVNASLRRLRRRSGSLATRRPTVLRNLERAGRSWYRATR